MENHKVGDLLLLEDRLGMIVEIQDNTHFPFRVKWFEKNHSACTYCSAEIDLFKGNYERAINGDN